LRSSETATLDDNVLRLFEHLFQILNAGGSDLAVNFLAINKHYKARDTVDVELLRCLRVVRSVDLADWVVRLLEGVHGGLHAHARPALWRPKIQQENLRFGAVGTKAKRRDCQRKCRCRESDHPFPPWKVWSACHRDDAGRREGHHA